MNSPSSSPSLSSSPSFLPCASVDTQQAQRSQDGCYMYVHVVVCTCTYMRTFRKYMCHSVYYSHTRTLKSRGALDRLPVGVSSLGMCSTVTPVTTTDSFSCTHTHTHTQHNIANTQRLCQWRRNQLHVSGVGTSFYTTLQCMLQVYTCTYTASFRRGAWGHH